MKNLWDGLCVIGLHTSEAKWLYSASYKIMSMNFIDIIRWFVLS